MAAEEGEYVEGMTLAERWGAEKGNHELHEWARMGDEGFFGTGFQDGRDLQDGERGNVERRTLNFQL
jgi:hypothetical protein